MLCLIKTIVPAGLAALGLLAGGLLLSPHAGADPSALVQPKTTTITLSGTAIHPDGSPAADLPVEIKANKKELVDAGGGGGQAPPPDALFQGRGQQQQKQPEFMSLGKTKTDATGKFSLKFNHKDVKAFQLEIGEKMKSSWIIKPMENKGKDSDLGTVQLREKVKA
jgi:hypothetical protein